MGNIDIDKIFGRRVDLPNSKADERLARLVGIDDTIEQLFNMLSMLLSPQKFEAWREQHHKNATSLFKYVQNRHSLIVIAGDVGTGKTELSETIGTKVARANKIDITLFPLSLSTRGSGLVGEMTSLISGAFSYIENESRKIIKDKNGSFKSGMILLIDEADAIAQSREGEQMHHEDRAGVNALIRGIDTLNRQKSPVAVIMCTNRSQSMDPAIMRRAVMVINFVRPDEERRMSILGPVLSEIGFTPEQIQEIVELTGEPSGRGYGYTFSDITQRLFHEMIMSAYPNNPIDFETTRNIVKKIKPTPPFKED